MASINWEKATTQKAGAMKKHHGREERVNGNHSNKDIDKSKSHLNIYIGADDYEPMLEKVKARIREVDKEHPPKRNNGDKRVTCIMLETPVPQVITEQGKAADFLCDAHRVIEQVFGAENVGGTVCHFDEQHWYTDKDGKERLSLIHGHTLLAAYAEWTDKKGNERKGINGKNCETKARLNALNKAMCDMCREKYGIEYNTAETPQRKSVERLKEETALRAEADRLRKENANALLNGIPPFELKSYPPKPTEPRKPDRIIYGTKQEHKENRKELKEWEQQHKTFINKTLPAWERECAAIDKENEQARQEWDRKYMTADNLSKVQRQLTEREQEITQQQQQNEAELRQRSDRVAKREVAVDKKERNIERRERNIKGEVQRRVRKQLAYDKLHSKMATPSETYREHMRRMGVNINEHKDDNATSKYQEER